MPRISRTLNWISSWLPNRPHTAPSPHTAPRRGRLRSTPHTADTLSAFELEPLEARALLSGVPTLAPIADVTLHAGSPLFIPLNGVDSELDPLSFTVSSDSANVLASIPQGNRSMRISVGGFGDMVFQLFENLVPRVTDHIIELAESSFYDGVIFHRVIDGFVIQGGDPTGTGTGGSSLGDFDDQFHPDLQHNRTGLLSMAKSTDDTNDSQFFITELDNTEDPNSEANLRNLDYNHSVFGVLTVGESVRQAISDVPVGGANKPLTDVVMNSVDVFYDDQNGALLLKAAEGLTTGSAMITVTVTNRDGLTAQQTFNVTIVPDNGPTADAQPFLADIPDFHTPVDTPIIFDLSATDVDGAAEFDTVFLDQTTLSANSLFIPVVAHPDLDYDVDFTTGRLTITPTNGLKGIQRFTVAAGQVASALDYQVVTVIIGAPDSSGPLADLNVNLNAQPSTLDLSSQFTASVPGDTVTLSVADNSNTELVTANLVGDTLTLSYAQGRVGSAQITIRATSVDGTPTATDAFIEETFTVTVANNSIDVDFNAFDLLSYGNQDTGPGSATVLHGGDQLLLEGNAWKRIDLPYNVTPNTVLEFDFRSLIQGDFQGIGFENDNDPTNDLTALFLLYGTQDSAGWPEAFTDFQNYNASAPAAQHYRIPVGQFFTGLTSSLVFINDDDNAPQDAQSLFANVQIYEATNFTGTDIAPYVVGQDAPNTAATLEDAGQSVSVIGNAWKQLTFAYTITPDTILEFDYQSTVEGELQGIGFDSDGDQLNANSIAFLLFGTQDAAGWSRAIEDFRVYDPANGLQHFVIPVGQYFTGSVTAMTFINDDDAAPQDADSLFANIRVYEQLQPGLVDFEGLTTSSYVVSQDAPATVAAAESAGRAFRVAGNAWKQVPFDVTITADTILEFDFQSPIEGELQGIGFDTDGDQFNEGSIVFLLAGTQSADGWEQAITDFRNYDPAAGDVQHYTIPIGQYITGTFTFMTFVNDDDAAPQDAVSLYSNVRLFEDPKSDILRFTSLPVSPYVTSQDAPVGTTATAEGTTGVALAIAGNAWKQVSFNYTITPDTVIEFDFLSDIQGELQGIGFDSDGDQFNENSIAFLLYGTQDATGWSRAVTDFRNYDDSRGPVWQHYVIPVGQYFTGSVTAMTFINDDDAAPQDAEILFANIEVFEDI